MCAGRRLRGGRQRRKVAGEMSPQQMTAEEREVDDYNGIVIISEEERENRLLF